MHKDQIKGTAKDVKGSMKESAGRALDDREMEAKGAAEKVSGKVQKGVGDIKDAARDALKR
jgi:uncharacterized protein YjbJ (UPF0337 family)